jgi:hypothetical protein
MDELRIEDRVRALYREPPEGFIAARDALVKELKTAGRIEEAAHVKAQRKPTMPAWAIDQLADRDPRAIEGLLDAGTEVRAAQQATMTSSNNADRLREASAARRQVLAKLARAAAEVLAESGRSPDTHMDEIRATLDSASIAPELGERLRTGTLDRPAGYTAGFGDVFGLQAVPGGSEVPTAGTAEESSAKGDETSKREMARLRRDAETAARAARRAREAADRLAGQVEATQRRLQELAEKHALAESQALEAELQAKRTAEAAEAGEQ